MPKARVLFSTVAWMVKDEVLGGVAHMTAVRGDEVDLPQAEFDRLSALGALGSPQDAEAVQHAAERGLGTPVDDAMLTNYSPEQVAAYLGQFPNDLDRVEAVEQSKPRPRAQVLKQVAKLRQQLAEHMAYSPNDGGAHGELPVSSEEDF